MSYVKNPPWSYKGERITEMTDLYLIQTLNGEIGTIGKNFTIAALIHEVRRRNLPKGLYA